MDIHQNVQSPGASETTSLDTQQIQPSPTPSLHCINCGRSLQHSRYHCLSRRNERETRILNVISKWAIPQQVTSSTRICHACWILADKTSSHFVSRPSTSDEVIQKSNPEVVPPAIDEQTNEENLQQQTVFIKLPNYYRAKGSEDHCFVERCNNLECHRVPVHLRKILFTEFNYYVPPTSRVCTSHLVSQSWDFIRNTFNVSSSLFTPDYIDDFIEFMKKGSES